MSRAASLEEAVVAARAALAQPRLLWPAEDRKERTPTEVCRLAGLRASGNAGSRARLRAFINDEHPLQGEIHRLRAALEELEDFWWAVEANPTAYRNE